MNIIIVAFKIGSEPEKYFLMSKNFYNSYENQINMYNFLIFFLSICIGDMINFSKEEILFFAHLFYLGCLSFFCIRIWSIFYIFYIFYLFFLDIQFLTFLSNLFLFLFLLSIYILFNSTFLYI